MPTWFAFVVLAGCLPPTATVSVVPEGSRINEMVDKAEADVAWTITCVEVAGSDCTAAAGGTRTVFAAAPEFKVAAGATGFEYATLSASDQRPLPGGDCWGCKVIASVPFACGRGLATAMLPAVSSGPVVIPPHIWIPNRELGVFSYRETGPLAEVGMPVSADAVPADFPFRINALLLARPKGTEVVTLRMTGPGIDLTRDYGDDPATDTAARDNADVMDAYLKDPLSKVKASGPGTVRVWLEFEGRNSDEVTLTVVANAATAPQ